MVNRAMQGRLRPFPNEPNPFACIICNHVFTSNQALLHHIEGHIIRNETPSMLRRQHDMSLFSANRNPFSNSSNFSHHNPPLFSPEQINGLGLHPYPLPPMDVPYASSFMLPEPNHFPFLSFNGVLVPATSSSSTQHPLYARNGQPSFQPSAPHFGYQAQRRSHTQDPNPNVYTRPLLNQLERKRGTEQDNGSSSSSSSAVDVDLTLKL